MPILFETPGNIDLRAITLMGVSVKPSSSSPIGYFGTGLKYAIAVIYRLGGRVVIHTAGRRIWFEVRDDEFRGQAFQLLWMIDSDGGAERLPFSLDYGKNWEAWMAFRELESNTRDERGKSWQDSYFDEPTVVEPNTTLIEVRGIDSVWAERNSIFLASSPIWANSTLEVHRRQGEGVYYRGVRVISKTSINAHYTYNILDNCQLTEDRTLSIYTAMTNIGLQLTQCTNPEICRRVITPGENVWEAGIDLNWAIDPSPEFLTALEAIADDHSNAVNKTARAKAISLGLKNSNLVPSEEQEAIIQAALEAFNRVFDLNWPRSAVILRNLGKGILGLADGDEIILAPEALDRGLFDLVATILEEHTHIVTGHYDCSREMQDFLFRKWLTLVARKQGVTL